MNADNSLASIHANDATPWLERFYNDTFSDTNSVMSYFGWDDGRFIFHNDSTQSISISVDGYDNDNLVVGNTNTTSNNDFIVSGSLHSTDIIGTGSLFLQPNQADARYLEVYNTSPTDTHITASGGQIFLGDDQTYVKVDNYGSVERIDVVAGNELVVSSSIVNLTGSLHQSGTFYPDVIDWFSSSIVQNTGSYVLTTNLSGVTQYDSYQNVASALQPYLTTGSLPAGVVSGSAQIAAFGYATTSSVSSSIATLSGSIATTDLNQNNVIAGLATTSSLTSLSSSIATTDLSQNNRLTSIEGITGSLATTSSLTSLSSSIATTDLGQNNRLTSIEGITGSLATTSSLTSLSSSIATTDLGQNNRLGSIESKTGSYATTGSNVFNGNQTITGSVNITGNISATSASFTYITTVYETASVIYSSGSNQFGDASNDTQTLWGTVKIPSGPVSITGSLTVSGSISGSNFTGSLQGSASYASNANSASYASNATSASYSNNSTSASYATNALSASQAQNAVSASQSTNAISSSYASNANSASFAQTAISSSQAANAVSASQATNANTASYVLQAVSSSYATNALSSSYASNANSASFAQTAISSSQAANAVSASQAQNAVSSSYSNNSTSASYSNNSTSASYASNATSASFSQNTISGSFSNFAVSSSYAQTASFASNGGVTQILAGPNIIVSPLSGQGQVTISSTGTGTGSFNTATGSYGSFYDTTNQLNPVANTPNSMSFNETAITNGVSISGSLSPFNTYIKTQNAGVYNIQFSAQLDKTDSGTDSVDIWIRKNGIDLLDTATTVTLTGNNDKSVAAWNWFVQSATNDYYQLIWASADTGMRLLAEASSSVHPGVPSVILTANRVDQFLSNTGSFNGDFNGSFTGSLQGTASFATNALSASYAPGVSIPAGTVSGSQQIVDLGFATTSSVNQKLDTGSFNSYTASMDARTGSYATTGSNSFIGQQNITGSVNITGSLFEKGNLYVVNPNMTATFDNVSSSYGGNVLFGWDGISAPQSVSTSSYVISGSNNILRVGQPLFTNGYYNYISGSNNIGIAAGGIILNTGSILRPLTSNNILGGAAVTTLTFISSSVGGGQPVFSQNIVNNGVTINMGVSGSITATGNIINGNTSILQTGSAIANLRSTFSNNNINSTFFVQNYLSSSFTVSNNNTVGVTHYIDNYWVNGFGTVGVTASRNLFQGQANFITFSGSPSSNTSRAVSDNFLGGNTVNINATVSGSNAGNSYGTIIYGYNLQANANSTGIFGGSAFFGRYNDTGSIANTNDIVFAVGTGTAAGSRRTGLYITSGSLININGNTIMSSSAQYPLYVSGTIAIQRTHFDGNPFNTTPSSNLAAQRIDGLNESFNSTMYDRAEITTSSYVTQTVNTGSNFVRTELLSSNAGLSAKLSLANYSGNGILTSNVNTEISGSLIVTGSVGITGSVQGNVNALSIASNTASLNLNTGNFFTLQLVSGSNTFINPSNIKAGQTINILLSTTGSGTVTFPSSVLQVSGSSYTPTTTTGKDIITLVSFDSSNLYLANVKNLV
jgi:hypothetical protein